MVTTMVVTQQNTLTEEMALQLGLSRDPVLQRIEGNSTQAQSEVIAAGTWPNPKFHYERETLNNEENHVEQKFVVSQQFDFSGRRALKVRAADRHFDAARYKSDAWRAELTKKIRERYYNALHQQERRQAYEATKKRIRLLSKVIEKRRHEGDVSLYDYQRVSTERATIEAKVSNAEVDFYTAWQTLWTLLGPDSRDFQSLQGDLLSAQATSLAELTASLDNQPALRQLKEQIEGFTLQQRAESRIFPDVTLALGLKREDTVHQTDCGLVINASIPIPVFDKRKDRLTHFQAQTLITQSEYKMTYDAARAELKCRRQTN